MSEDEFTRLFKHFDKRLSLIEVKLETYVTKTEFSTFLNSFDDSIKRNEIIFQEILALRHKADRQDGWLHKIAKATNVKLET